LHFKFICPTNADNFECLPARDGAGSFDLIFGQVDFETICDDRDNMSLKSMRIWGCCDLLSDHLKRLIGVSSNIHQCLYAFLLRLDPEAEQLRKRAKDMIDVYFVNHDREGYW